MAVGAGNHPVPTRRLVRAAALLVALTVVGCGGSEPTATLAPVVTTTTVPSATTEAPPATTAAPPVLAGVEGDLPGIRLELNRLERSSDEVVRLSFTLVNTGTDTFTFGDNFGTDASVNGISIADTANDQQLGTLTDEAGACRCSRNLTTLAPGQKLPLFAELGAPPADIGLVSVQVPHFPGVQRIRMT